MFFGPAHSQPTVLAHLANGLAVLITTFCAAQFNAQLGGHEVVEIIAHFHAQGVLFGGEIDEHNVFLWTD